MKDPEKVKEGRRFREAGARFERKVRADLESKGWIVDRWSNQVEETIEPCFEGDPRFLNAKLVKAKSFMGRTRSNGFPDFIVFKSLVGKLYDVHGVEVKMKGILRKEEKEKCNWLLKNKIFGKIFVAEKQGSEINYKEYTHSEQAVK